MNKTLAQIITVLLATFGAFFLFDWTMQPVLDRFGNLGGVILWVVVIISYGKALLYSFVEDQKDQESTDRSC